MNEKEKLIQKLYDNKHITFNEMLILLDNKTNIDYIPYYPYIPTTQPIITPLFEATCSL